MDYKEKYNVALRRAKEYHDNGGAPLILEVIFPELKESKDERIRKTLIAFFRDWERTKSHCWNVNVTDIIAWLEKQDHMIDPDKLIEWIKHYNITDCDVRTSIIPDSSPTSNPHFVRWFSEDFIEQFKKNFGL